MPAASADPPRNAQCQRARQQKADEGGKQRRRAQLGGKDEKYGRASDAAQGERHRMRSQPRPVAKSATVRRKAAK